MAEKILTGVKHIYFTPWNSQDTGLETGASAKVELTGVIGDTVAISQDDPETTDIECETRDEPLYSATKLGKWNITMDSGDVSLDVLEKVLGYTKVGTTIAYAPTAYTAKYACIEIVMATDKFVLPRVQCNSKFDASSLKTGVAKGTVAGTGNSCWVTSGSNEFETPFFVAPQNATFTCARQHSGSN